MLLLHCDDTLGSSTLTDAMGYVTQQSGSGTIIADADAFGGKCLDCTSSYKRLVHPLMYLGFDDYTLEFRFKRSGTQVPKPTLFSNDMIYGAGTNGYIEVSLNHPTYHGVALWWDGGVRCSSGADVTDTQWHWFAITRQAGTTRMFLDGAMVCSTDYAGIVNLHDLDLGYVSDGNAKGDLLFDEVRLTRGVARYTSAYTPATQPFSEDAVTPWWSTGDEHFDSVVLQLPLESSLVHETTGKTVSVVGAPTLVESFTPFGAHSMSCGSGNYALVASTGGPTIGANSWTYNVWCQPTSDDLGGNYHETFCVRENGSNFLIGFAGGSLMLWNGNQWSVNPCVKAGQSLHIEVSHDYVAKRLYMFVNGVLIYTTSCNSTDTSFWAYAARASVGGDYAGLGQHWYGLIKDLRLTKGVVRHTASFFPPLAANPTAPAVITGTTTNDGFPVSAKVRCYRRSDGLLVGEVQSAADGTFTIGAYGSQDCYLVALPPDGTTHNALIFDKMRGT